MIKIRILKRSEALNSVNYENYLYPSRYNDAHEMIRYFVFRFVGEDSLDQKEVLDSIINDDTSDGIILGLLPQSADSVQNLRKKAELVSRNYSRAIFAIPIAIDKALSTLTEREASIIRKRNGLDTNRPMTLEEIGALLNVTRERIRQIEEKALRKLRHPSRSKKLKEYL